jgi:hypothetical protein
MAELSHGQSLEEVAAMLARLLTSPGSAIREEGSFLTFETELSVRPLARSSAPVSVWAVDGGQALVADARCLQIYVSRSSRVCWSAGRAALEEQDPLQAWLLGPVAPRPTFSAPVAPDCSVDINLLREWGEWSAAESCVSVADPGSLVLVDGDLEPDWRISPTWLEGLIERAEERGVTLMGVTKHTSLSWGGSPLLSVLERLVPDRSLWWVPVAHSASIQVVVARLDPDARFAFRVDMPASADPASCLATLSAVCDDAAFPGYPYPLSSADRLAACPGWVRADVWSRIEELLDQAGVPADLRERAFADRHRLMERY